MNFLSPVRPARSILSLVALVTCALAGCPTTTVPAIDAGPTDDATAPVDGSLDSGPRCTTASDCDDGLYCNGDETCMAGRCMSAPRTCDDGVACTVDTCSEERVRCENRAPDADADGYGDAACVDGTGAALGNDCDDSDDTRFPGNPEVCDDVGHDEDCDGTTLGGLDADGDGHESDVCCNPITGGGRTCGDDCDDARRQINPTGTEVCDGLDDDCDGTIDDGVTVTVYEDDDRDGHGDPARSQMACAGISGLVAIGDDCDDTRVDRHPAQLEFCDMIDNDCNGTVDDNTRAVRWYTDSDGDGFGSASSGAVDSCTPIVGASLLGTDCDDGRAAINPSAAELCDGLDNDCSGTPDYAIAPGDFEDDDADGYVDIGCGAPLGVDCEDNNPSAGPGEPESCDGRDNDCDTSVDEDVATYAWFRDADGDGYGTDATTLVVSCLTIPGHVRRGGDCDDASPTRNPAATETCTGRDEDCDGTVDEAPASDECIDALFSDLACIVGVCRSVGCLADHADCDGTSTNGCETILAADPLHCGTCSNRCGASEVCSAGSCTTSCGAGLVDCSGRCVDAATDPLYCGASGDCAGANRGVICPSGSTCVAGACTTSCPPGQIVCAGRCVDPLTDRAYCGASSTCTGASAGSVCASGQVCAAGSCATSCPAGQVDCAGRCIDPMTDRGYCGASGTCTGASAGIACGAGQVCNAGLCTTSCPSGQIDCAGRCVDPGTDRAYCGASGDCSGANAGDVCTSGEVCAAGVCATSCPPTQVICGGVCVDPATDRTYCGASGACTGASDGTVCSAGQVCSAGTCTVSCASPLIDCGGTCVDPRNDPMACGMACTVCASPPNTTPLCLMSACATICRPGFLECNAVPADGCETDPSTDELHCGNCGTTCRVEPNAVSTCMAGSCGPLVCNGGFSDCDMNLGTGANGCETVGTGCPRLLWRYTWGDANDDWPVGSGATLDVAADAAGNVYAMGTYGSDIGVAGMNYTSARFGGVIIALTPTGTLRWVTNFGAIGSGDLNPARVVVDPGTGDVLVSGSGWGGNGMVGATNIGAQNGGCTPFVVRLASTTGAVVWGRTFPTTQCATMSGVSPTPSGDALVSGWYQQNLTLDAFDLPGFVGVAQGFIARISMATGVVTSAVGFGDPAANEYVNGAVELPGGNVAVVGYYDSGAARVGTGAPPLPVAGGSNAFYGSITPAGAHVHSAAAATANFEMLQDVRVGPSGNYYLSGYYDISTTLGSTTLSGSGYGTILARIDATTGNPTWVTGHTGGGNAYFGLRRILVDSAERVRLAVATSYTAATRFSGVPIPPSGPAPGGGHVYTIDGATGAAIRLEVIGANTSYTVNGIALTPSGQAIVVGWFNADGLIIDGFPFTSVGFRDQFVMRLAF